MDTLTGTVAMVTGAFSGIGEGIAKMLAVEGVRVGLVARHQDQLDRVAAEIREQDGTALAAPADLGDERALRAAVDQTQTMFGPIDILVNSGGNIYISPIGVRGARTVRESVVQSSLADLRDFLPLTL